jgi:hypothetical protein
MGAMQKHMSTDIRNEVAIGIHHHSQLPSGQAADLLLITIRSSLAQQESREHLNLTT